MRTTFNIEEDALALARELAARENLTLGQAVSQLVRDGFQLRQSIPLARGPRGKLRGRFALLPARDEVVTSRHVRDLMEREGI